MQFKSEYGENQLFRIFNGRTGSNRVENKKRRVRRGISMEKLRDKTNINVICLEKNNESGYFSNNIFELGENDLTICKLRKQIAEDSFIRDTSLFSNKVKCDIVYTCQFCEHVFSNKFSLSKHEKKHYFCQYCKVKFKSLKAVLKHKISCNIMTCMTSHPIVNLIDIALCDEIRVLYKAAFDQHESYLLSRKCQEIKQEKINDAESPCFKSVQEYIDSRNLDSKEIILDSSHIKDETKTEALIYGSNENILHNMFNNVVSSIKKEPEDIVDRQLVSFHNSCIINSSGQQNVFANNSVITCNNSHKHYFTKCKIMKNLDFFGQFEAKCVHDPNFLSSLNKSQSNNQASTDSIHPINEKTIENSDCLQCVEPCIGNFENLKDQDDQNPLSEIEDDPKVPRFSRFKSEREEARLKWKSKSTVLYDLIDEHEESEDFIKECIKSTSRTDLPQEVGKELFICEKVKRNNCKIEDCPEIAGNPSISSRLQMYSLPLVSAVHNETFTRATNIKNDLKGLKERTLFNGIQKNKSIDKIKYVRFTNTPNLNLFIL